MRGSGTPGNVSGSGPGEKITDPVWCLALMCTGPSFDSAASLDLGWDPTDPSGFSQPRIADSAGIHSWPQVPCCACAGTKGLGTKTAISFDWVRVFRPDSFCSIRKIKADKFTLFRIQFRGRFDHQKIEKLLKFTSPEQYKKSTKMSVVSNSEFSWTWGLGSRAILVVERHPQSFRGI